MKRQKSLISKITLAVIVFATTLAAFWLGLIPQKWSPFAPIDLAESEQWFLDPRLAVLRRDPELCQQVLKKPFIVAKPISSQPFKNGCGWRNSVRVSETGFARIPVSKITCEMAVAFSLWVTHVVQPAAEEFFGTSVRQIEHMGTYSCRNIIGNRKWRTVRSQHASANAIDISGFRLKDGRRIRLVTHWKDKGVNGHFLRMIHRRSCKYFRVSLSPDYNLAHKDHFHFDRGVFKTCR